MKITIKANSNDKTFNIPITSTNNMLGSDDSVESLVNGETNNSINNVFDLEVRRILPISGNQIEFRFYDGFSYVATLPPAEFTSDDIGTTALNNSFFVLQLFDTFSGNTQTKYHTGYLSGYNFESITSIYDFNSDMEFSNLYITQDLLKSMSGVSKNFYMKFLFYSGKSGKFYSFFNRYDTVETERKMYGSITINPTTLKYSYNSILSFDELLKPAFNAFIDSTIPTVRIEKPTYPLGNTFTSDGNYEII